MDAVKITRVLQALRDERISYRLRESTTFGTGTVVRVTVEGGERRFSLMQRGKVNDYDVRDLVEIKIQANK